MKIESASLQMGASHVKLTQTDVHERLRFWTGPRPDVPESRGDRVSLSDEARRRAAQPQQSASSVRTDEERKDSVSGTALDVLRQLVEILTGRKVELFEGLPDGKPTADQVTAQAADPGFGAEYEYHEIHDEQELSQFSAQGELMTQDGVRIRFDFSLTMARQYHEERHEQVIIGNAVRKDPLIINYAGNAATLAEQTMAFDLDADGQLEQVHRLQSGSGFLALDRNQDGKINDGRELFGPLSGNGFADLAREDSDQNGWIDESDPVFAQLRLWTRGVDGKDQLLTLKQAGVGAISLASLATPFDLYGAGHQLQGQIQRSGIALSDDGNVRSVQQLDLMV